MHMLTDFFEREDIVASLNRTNETKIKKLKKELAEKDDALAEKDALLAEKDAHIESLQRKLADIP